MGEKDQEYRRNVEEKMKEQEEKTRMKTLKYEEKRYLALQNKQFLEILHEKSAFQNKDRKERR